MTSSDPVWKGTITTAFGGGTVSFVIDAVTGSISQATSGGPVACHPGAGYAPLTGVLTSTVDFRPGSLPAHPGDAWAQAEEQLLCLVPGKSYTLTITEN